MPRTARQLTARQCATAHAHVQQFLCAIAILRQLRRCALQKPTEARRRDALHAICASAWCRTKMASALSMQRGAPLMLCGASTIRRRPCGGWRGRGFSPARAARAVRACGGRCACCDVPCRRGPRASRQKVDRCGNRIVLTMEKSMRDTAIKSASALRWELHARLAWCASITPRLGSTSQFP